MMFKMYMPVMVGDFHDLVSIPVIIDIVVVLSCFVFNATYIKKSVLSFHFYCRIFILDRDRYFLTLELVFYFHLIAFFAFAGPLLTTVLPFTAKVHTL